jgi:hypothetical protein
MKNIYSKTKLLLVISTVFVLTSCASVQLERQKLKQNKIASINYNSSQLSYTQSTAGSTGGGAAFGLLGVMIGAGVDAGINSNRNKKFAKINDALDGFDMNPVYLDKIQHIKGPSFSQEIQFNTFTDFVPNSQIEPNILYISNSFFLSPDHKIINGYSLVKFKQEPESSIYTNSFSANKKIDFPNSEIPKEEVTDYLTNNIDLVKKSLTSIVEDLVLQLEKDFNEEPEK